MAGATATKAWKMNTAVKLIALLIVCWVASLLEVLTGRNAMVNSDPSNPGLPFVLQLSHSLGLALPAFVVGLVGALVCRAMKKRYVFVTGVSLSAIVMALVWAAPDTPTPYSVGYAVEPSWITVTGSDTLRIAYQAEGKNGHRVERVRIANMDVPQTAPAARCPREAELAGKAQATLKSLLSDPSAKIVVSPGPSPKHDNLGQIVEQVTVNGREVPDLMIGAGVASPINGGRANWCTTETP
jgi:endonuclease YncB( thermonuclease family)